MTFKLNRNKYIEFLKDMLPIICIKFIRFVIIYFYFSHYQYDEWSIYYIPNCKIRFLMKNSQIVDAMIPYYGWFIYLILHLFS